MKYRYDNFLYEQQAEIEQAEKKCQKEEREREKGGLKRTRRKIWKFSAAIRHTVKLLLKKKEKKKRNLPRETLATCNSLKTRRVLSNSQ